MAVLRIDRLYSNVENCFTVTLRNDSGFNGWMKTLNLMDEEGYVVTANSASKLQTSTRGTRSLLCHLWVFHIVPV